MNTENNNEPIQKLKTKFLLIKKFQGIYLNK